MKKHFYIAISAAIILLSGCNGGNSGNSEASAEKSSVSESSPAQASVTESVPVTVSETEEKISEPQAEELPAEKKGYEPYELKLYNSLGTGIPRPENYGENLKCYYFRSKLNNVLSLMKDKTASKKIEDEVNALNESIGDNESFNEHHSCFGYNGYLFYVNYVYAPTRYCAVFDLRTGERLELSDMFFEGEEFLRLLNKKINEEIQKLYCEDYEYEVFEYLPIKREFAGLTEDGFYFDDNNFYFPADNPYMTRYVKLNVNLFDFDTVLNVPYDMADIFYDEGETHINIYAHQNFIRSDRYVYSRHFQTGNINIYLFEESMYLTAEQTEFLNTQALSVTGEILDRMRRENNWTAYTGDEAPLYRTYESYDGTVHEYKEIYDIYIQVITNRIAQICFYQSDWYDDRVPRYSLYYDLETLQPLDTKQFFELIFGDEEYVWSNVHVNDYSIDGINYRIYDMEGFIDGEAPDISRLKTEDIYIYDPGFIDYNGEIDDCYISGSICSRSYYLQFLQ